MLHIFSQNNMSVRAANPSCRQTWMLLTRPPLRAQRSGRNSHVCSPTSMRGRNRVRSGNAKGVSQRMAVSSIAQEPDPLEQYLISPYAFPEYLACRLLCGSLFRLCKTARMWFCRAPQSELECCLARFFDYLPDCKCVVDSILGHTCIRHFIRNTWGKDISAL